MHKVIVKQGPVVFISRVFVMELFAIVFFTLISYLEDYQMLFTSFNLDSYISYYRFLLIAFFLFQMIYLIIIFIDWYFSYYEIGEREIMKKSGIIFHRKKFVSLADVASVEIYQSPIDRRIKHATLILERSNNKITKISNIPNFEECANFIKQNIKKTSGDTSPINITSLLKRGEGSDLEFKETLRYDLRKNEVNKEIEKTIIKSIVGFLNASGGNLLIGVNNEGNVVGLEKDYNSLPRKNRDGFENHLTMLIRTMIGLSYTRYIKISFENVQEKEVCIVSVREGYKPAYLKAGDKKEEFFVRTGNTTQPFSMSETEEYIKNHF